MNKLEIEFSNEMVNIYKIAKKEVNYTASRLITLISSIGGVNTAKTLISKGNVTEGFEILWEAKRLDLTVEALVIKEKYAPLFTIEEVESCKDRLKEFEYFHFESNTGSLDNPKIQKNELNNSLDESRLNEKIVNLNNKDVFNEANKKCGLISELRKLKESAKEAVEGIEEFSKFKKYMHVPRKVEDELLEKLQNIKNNEILKKLILVCGSVGDGKSHVISQIKYKYSHLLNDFIIYNDATESDDPAKTYKEKLDELFSPFSDDNIYSYGTDKVIVAINLGTLSNFIEDQEYKIKYSILYEYVGKNKIIEDEIVNNYKHEIIDYVNFSDYSIYELTQEGPISKFMSFLLSKIINNDNSNQFYNEYIKCDQCIYKRQCPLKINYELIQQNRVKDSIIDVIIEAIIRNKIIVSVRSLQDFYYSILVPQDFEEMIEQDQLETFDKNILNSEKYWKMLLPNMLFEFKDSNILFSGLTLVDPLNERSESIDEFIVEINILTHKKETLINRFGYDEFLILNNSMESIYLNNFNSKITPLILKTYLRFARLVNDKIVPKNKVYNDYVRFLFYSNIKDYEQMQNFYIMVINAIYKWNGNNIENNWINISNFFMCKDYVVSQELKIEPVISNQIEKDKDVVYKFETEIKVALKNKKVITEPINIYIDYELYNLLVKIVQGYRLNNCDRENYIAFIDNLNKLLDQGDKKEVVKIAHKTTNNNERFELKKNIFGGYSFDRAN